MGFEFVTRRYWTLEALVGYLESLSAYFSCDIGTVKIGKSIFLHSSEVVGRKNFCRRR